jgi:transposase
MLDITQIDRQGLNSLDADQLRALIGQLLDRGDRDANEIVWRDTKIDKLTFEIAQLKRLQYGKKSEQLGADQRALFDEAVDGDIAAIEEPIAALQASLPAKTGEQKQTPRRTALPARLPRVERHHEPDDTTCACGCVMKRVGAYFGRA